MKSELFLLAVCLSLVACGQTREVVYGSGDGSASLDRQVEVSVSRAYYREAPDCAVVLASGGGKVARAGGEALARHLRDRLGRVVGPAERDRIARATGLDPAAPDDARQFSEAANCRYRVHVRPWGGESVYAVFWTEVRVGLDADLTDDAGGAPLWRARHIAERSGGGLPLSPVSALVGAVGAGRLAADGEEVRSLADDAARRLAATLPDLRAAGLRMR